MKPLESTYSRNSVAGPVCERSVRNSLSAWAFLLPAVVLISLSVLVPALMALVMSFTTTGLDVSEPLRFVGLANLERLLSDPMARQVLVTTFFYLIGVVPPIVFGALALAVLVNQGLSLIHISEPTRPY